jgi:hypothetical protein
MSSKDVKQEVTPVEIDGDQNLELSSKTGVEKDELPLGKILGWGGAIVGLIAIFFVILPYSFNIADAIKEDQVARNASNYPIKDLRIEDSRKLQNFGIIDKEAGVYHMPIDSAISILAVD